MHPSLTTTIILAIYHLACHHGCLLAYVPRPFILYFLLLHSQGSGIGRVLL